MTTETQTDTDAPPHDGADTAQLRRIIEAALLAAGEPVSIAQIGTLFDDGDRPSPGLIQQALEALQDECAGRGVELKEVSSGWRLQVRGELMPWVSRLWEERPQRYSRALLETLALVAYRQPITRGEIESVRGVSLSSNIIRTLQEREWIRIVGHRDVPGKPALFGTTRAFLDYFNLRSLDELPTLAEIKDLDSLEPELAFSGANDDSADQVDESSGIDETPEIDEAPEVGDQGAEAAAEDELPGRDAE